MSYFDPRKKTEIIVDASPSGLGGLLVQEGKVLSYASRALSDVESRTWRSPGNCKDKAAD